MEFIIRLPHGLAQYLKEDSRKELGTPESQPGAMTHFRWGNESATLAGAERVLDRIAAELRDLMSVERDIKYEFDVGERVKVLTIDEDGFNGRERPIPHRMKNALAVVIAKITPTDPNNEPPAYEIVELTEEPQNAVNLQKRVVAIQVFTAMEHELVAAPIGGR